MKKTASIIAILFCFITLFSCTPQHQDAQTTPPAATALPTNSQAPAQTTPIATTLPATTPAHSASKIDVKTDPSALLPFMNAEGQYGYMDNQGNVIIQPAFDWAMRFSEGFAVVGKDKKMGYIDAAGNIVIPMEYDFANWVSDGIATATINKPEGDTTVYLDTNGKELLRVDYYRANPFHEGLAAVMETKSSKWKYIDKTGKTVLEPQNGGGDFHEGLARFSRTGENGMGYIDKTGKVVLEGFYYAGDFSEGLAAARKDGKWGYINKSGEFVLMLGDLSQYDNLYDFSGGMAVVMAKNLVGVIDKTGKYVIEPKYKNFGGVFNGLAMIFDTEGNGTTTFHYETFDGKRVDPKI